VSSNWFGEVSEHLGKYFRNLEFVYKKYHICMLSMNVNQYLAFRPLHWTWWVYEWGAQVRKHKYGKSPHLKKPSSSQRSTIVPSYTTKSQKDISTLYSTILQYSKDPQRHTTKIPLNQQDPHGLLFVTNLGRHAPRSYCCLIGNMDNRGNDYDLLLHNQELAGVGGIRDLQRAELRWSFR
jgi:hypothetical protein